MKHYPSELTGKYLYYGNLGFNEQQYKTKKFMGLALNPKHEFEFAHNAYDELPVQDNSVEKIQAQDVFEHLEYSKIPKILDDIYRVLAPNGIFRLSVPDYRSPLLRRSIFNAYGNPIADMMMGTSVKYDPKNQEYQVIFSEDGNAHLWFPNYELLLNLIIQSNIRKCSNIIFHHYFADDNHWKTELFPENEMPILRCPPNDMRAEGKPISIIVDFIK